MTAFCWLSMPIGSRSAAGRDLPDRADIDPVEMPPRLLPYLFIVEYAQIPGRWRYRLMGTEMVERLGADLTGCFLDKALGGSLLQLPGAAQQRDPQRASPTYTESTLTSDDGGVLLTRRMLVPLTSGGGDEVAMILGAQTYHGAHAAPAHSLVLTDRGAIEEMRGDCCRRRGRASQSSRAVEPSCVLRDAPSALLSMRDTGGWQKIKDLILRSPRSGRLEGRTAAGPVRPDAQNGCWNLISLRAELWPAAPTASRRESAKSAPIEPAPCR